MSSDSPDKRQRKLQIIAGFTLMKDDFFKRCMTDNDEGVELILRIVLNMPKLKVLESKAEYVIQNLKGRSVRLDVKARDENGNIFNIEIQRSDKGAGRIRARHNSSMLDANALKAGEDVNNLPDTYVIFITENDVIGDSRAKYTVERTILETNALFNDGSHIVYVNGSYRGDDPIGRLMHDFNCRNSKDMYYKSLSDMVHYYKETEEGVQNMCREIEELCNEEREEGKLEGLKEGKIEGIKEGIKEGIRAFIRDNINEGRSKEQILLKLVEFFNLANEEAEGYFEEFKPCEIK